MDTRESRTLSTEEKLEVVVSPIGFAAKHIRGATTEGVQISSMRRESSENTVTKNEIATNGKASRSIASQRCNDVSPSDSLQRTYAEPRRKEFRS